MKTNFTNDSRRLFLGRIALASTILAVSPTVLLGQTSKKSLQFTVFGNDSMLNEIIEKSAKITLVDTSKLADVIYVKDISKIAIQKTLIAGKHLIVERHENSDFIIEKCREMGVLLAIVERSEDDKKLFKSVDYYETNLNQSFDFQKVIIKLDFLVQNTENEKFKTFCV
jgi:hypothetical protein